MSQSMLRNRVLGRLQRSQWLREPRNPRAIGLGSLSELPLYDSAVLRFGIAREIPTFRAEAAATTQIRQEDP